jgi:hypothetical protein
MGILSSLLKWGILALIVLLVPWLLFPVAIYIAWKFGFFKGIRDFIKSIRKSIRIRDRVFKLGAPYCKDLRGKTAACTYYLTRDDSPFALLPHLEGYRCVSAIVISDNSGGMNNYKNAIDEAMRFLSNSYSTIVLTLEISGGAIGCRIQVSEPCFDSSDGWLQRLGNDIADRGWALSNAIQSLSPSLRVKVCRGGEILVSPLMEV